MKYRIDAMLSKVLHQRIASGLILEQDIEHVVVGVTVCWYDWQTQVSIVFQLTEQMAVVVEYLPSLIADRIQCFQLSVQKCTR